MKKYKILLPFLAIAMLLSACSDEAAVQNVLNEIHLMSIANDVTGESDYSNFDDMLEKSSPKELEPFTAQLSDVISNKPDINDITFSDEFNLFSTEEKELFITALQDVLLNKTNINDIRPVH